MSHSRQSDKESHWSEQVEKAGRGENGWKASNEIIPSSVAAFIVIFALNVKDRHKGNMILTGGNKLANIDFGCDRHLLPFRSFLHSLRMSLRLALQLA